MRNSQRKPLKGYSKTRPPLSSPLALGLCAAVGIKDPVAAILDRARILVDRSGMKQPPFKPFVYAQLRDVNEITYEQMEAEGRLIKTSSGFLIELRKDRPHARKNFTCAHEIGHTFFYEAVPAIKYRRLSLNEPSQDPDEEFLCNVAASELLMPAKSLAEVASDFHPSCSSLMQLAALYEASLSAMAVRLVSLGIWTTKFILWERKEASIRARWIIEPNRALRHFPSVELEDYERSSVNTSFKVEEATEGEEWLLNRNRFVYCKMQSIRLSRDRVLSCIGFKDQQSVKANATTTLPTGYICNCNGTGTRLFKMNGYTFASACLAHRATTKSPTVTVVEPSSLS